MYTKRNRIIDKCKLCGDKLIGRSDSFFCSNKCRITFHNRKERTEEDKINRSLLTKQWYSKNKKNTPERLMFFRIRRFAKKKKIPFNIDISDIKIPDKCPLLKIDLFFSDKKATANTPSIDKIIPQLGYTKGNVWVISNKAYTMKQDTSIDLLKVFARNVLDKL